MTLRVANIVLGIVVIIVTGLSLLKTSGVVEMSMEERVKVWNEEFYDELEALGIRTISLGYHEYGDLGITCAVHAIREDGTIFCWNGEKWGPPQ